MSLERWINHRINQSNVVSIYLNWTILQRNAFKARKHQANRMWAGLAEVGALNSIKYAELIKFIWHRLCACAMKNRLCKLISIEHFPGTSALVYRLTDKFTKNDTLKIVKWNANELNVTHISRAYANWKTDNCTQVQYRHIALNAQFAAWLFWHCTIRTHFIAHFDTILCCQLKLWKIVSSTGSILSPPLLWPHRKWAPKWKQSRKAHLHRTQNNTYPGRTHHNRNHLIIFYRLQFAFGVCERVCVCSLATFSNRLFRSNGAQIRLLRRN